MAVMAGNEAQVLAWGPQLIVSAVAVVFSLLALVSALFTWFTSRANKVRLVEDQVLSQLRAHQVKADHVDTRIAEWQVTVTDILAQVEEFFDRTVKERKRIAQHNAQAERNAGGGPVDIRTLPRAEQLKLVDQRFLDSGR